ncbi:phospholipase effector Tle1 domain-containing protein [Chryseobacterium sp. BIGb0232]|uniref:phospholipase effector Tle1 domain-containing protein n=1 Tax=Chryseobacterium sp. BIGb0232 TaxID=2940598 RepID=UPI000F4A6070|nr:DUF2235 domain-containing protein [Chryseobacterium sp. BIGb0232]MCS4302475.1 hypothetical protein [Chryseobacterium sp. BIGb0232]ROS18417.1 putative alpha/beta hydrolase family protein DUF2235 [Chryseobacterium nakagawai]
MGKTFVYNTGNSSPPIDEIHLEIGVFFDGTLNSLKNTEMRQKYRDGKNKIESNDTDDEVLIKEAAIDETTKAQEKQYEELKNKEISDKDKESDRFLKASHRGWLDKQGVDNSYSNDFTNVARMYKCSQRDEYGVYVEGIGTLDGRRDVDDGFQYGSGETGVRGKVRKGCEMVAERIDALKKKHSPEKMLSKITIDTFGFSRGAAAARNFSYEINGNKRPKDVEIRKKTKLAGYRESRSYGNDGLIAEYEDIWIDKDKTEVNPAYLVDGKLPKFGFLGYYLLSKEILTKEELEELELDVRFIGVYDTVSSYEEFGDMGALERVGYRGPLHATFGSKHNFGDDVEQLQLKNPGPYYKAVHFTAMDEHRENFSLTRFPGSVEKDFPGVHCDIGGAYESGTETVDEIEVADKHPGVGFNSYSSWNALKRLEERMEEIKAGHWYHDGQISIKKESHLWIFQYHKIRGVRFLRKEYSYIPLHFMEKHGIDYYNHQIIVKTESTYSIDKDEHLPAAKRHLEKYVFGDGKPWHFVKDEDLGKEAARLNAEAALEQPTYGKDKDGNRIVNIPAVQVTSQRWQDLLRTLRNKYLHWSANRDWMGMDPNNDYQRRIY